MPFLSDREPRPLSLATPGGIRPTELFVGTGHMPLEVAVLDADRQPSITQLKELHHARLGRRAAPVMIVVLWSADRAAVCGALPASLSAHTDLDRGQVERVCRAALDAADRHAAIRFLTNALPQLTAPVPGLRNEGLFALHELTSGVPRRSDWRAAAATAGAVLAARGRELIEKLGYQTQPLPGPASLLLGRGSKVAIAVFLERPDEIDPPSAQFDNLSPVSFALAKADHERLDYVVISAGAALRVYPVKPGIGTGRRGRTETFVELNLDLLRNDHAGYLWLLCSADALTGGGAFTQILATSERYAADLSVRLRERVYDDVVPQLARAIHRQRRLRRNTAEQLSVTYDMALLVLFRLLFIAYAEDKELLPLNTSAAYREHSLKHMAQRLLHAQRDEVEFGDEDFYWTEVKQLWKAVDKGNREWNVPAYNGGLFSEDGDASATKLASISLADSDFAPALAALTIDETDEGDIGPIDFRSLGVREFGTIYEGLLESELSVAETDLAIHPKTGAYMPATSRTGVDVEQGEVYLHNASGARKSSGAYYTKSFAVEHLLDAALEPAIDDHFARLDATDDRKAGDRFFEFRVADIAMGSGHFLVAAIDRIERRFSNYLANRRLPGVTDELERLRVEAAKQLGDDWAGDPIEDTQLLRRQIARRCIFGVDLNPLAVELARLSVWIHTFVPGLPLSLLDQNLVIGNSLVGIATFDEANEILAGSNDLFSPVGVERLQRAQEPLQKLARLADATAAEIKEARQLYVKMSERTAGERALLNVLTAARIDEDVQRAVDQGQIATLLEGDSDAFTDRIVRKSEAALAGLAPLHFPTVFPQVFLGDRAGFDVILGNPPWDELTVEVDGFWARHYPGLRSLSQREQEKLKSKLERERPDLSALLEREQERSTEMRRVILSGAYPGMGTGDPDLYKAFTWRFWQLISDDGGRIGVVLPRSALAARGSAEFRKNLFASNASVEITMLLNNRQWAFDDVHPQYTIGLVSIHRSGDESTISLRGPFNSAARFHIGRTRAPAKFSAEEIASWTDTASLPLLPSDESLEVFAQLRKAPRLDYDDGGSWRARPHRELDATNDKPLMDVKSASQPRGFWPVYKGESFDLWHPDTGKYYAWADPKKMCPALHDKRLRARSAFEGFSTKWMNDSATLPCNYARIVFRDITRSTDTRTMRAALVPPNVFLTNKAPYFLWPRGDENDQAYLLGVLSSIPLDWYARRFVEISMNFFVLNPFPIPRPADGSALRREVIAIAGRLSSIDDRYSKWAAALGVECGPIVPSEADVLIARLDAVVARLYGLTAGQLRHIFETFHEGWDYADRLGATMSHFQALEGTF
jgi:hypothetical protein